MMYLPTPMIRQQKYQEGEVVLPSGELGKGFCILEEGTVEVIRDDKVISEIDVVGSIFGELRNSRNEKRRDHTCKSSRNCKTCRRKYFEIVSKNP